MLRVIVLFVFVVVALASEGKIQFNPWCLTLRAGRNRPWRALAFLPKSSVLTKIGIIYTQLLQEENIFPIMEPAKWSLMLAQKVSKSEWKTQSKISCHYTWLLHDKNCPSRWRFLRSLLTARNTAAKRKEKEKNERRKKSKSLKTWVTFSSKNDRSQNFDFCACPSQNVVKCRLPCCKCLFDYIKANFANIHPKKSPKCSKRCFSPKSPGGNGLMAW